MHALDRLAWWMVAALFPAAPDGAYLEGPRGDGPTVGAGYPKRHAQRLGATAVLVPDGGVLADLGALSTDTLDASRAPAAVRSFFQR